MEKKEKLNIVAESPEKDEKIKEEMPVLKQIIDDIKERAVENLKDTGDVESAIKIAVRESLNEARKRGILEKEMEREEKMLQLFNEYSLTRDEDIRKKFEKEFDPAIAAMTNAKEARVGAISRRVTPEFKEVREGYFRVIEENNRYYLFPYLLIMEGFGRYILGLYKACFEVEIIKGHPEVDRITKIEKPAICSKTEEGWILKEKGKLIIEEK